MTDWKLIESWEDLVFIPKDEYKNEELFYIPFREKYRNKIQTRNNIDNYAASSNLTNNINQHFYLIKPENKSIEFDPFGRPLDRSNLSHEYYLNSAFDARYTRYEYRFLPMFYFILHKFVSISNSSIFLFNKYTFLRLKYTVFQNKFFILHRSHADSQFYMQDFIFRK